MELNYFAPSLIITDPGNAAAAAADASDRCHSSSRDCPSPVYFFTPPHNGQSATDSFHKSNAAAE